MAQPDDHHADPAADHDAGPDDHAAAGSDHAAPGDHAAAGSDEHGAPAAGSDEHAGSGSGTDADHDAGVAEEHDGDAGVGSDEHHDGDAGVGSGSDEHAAGAGSGSDEHAAGTGSGSDEHAATAEHPMDLPDLNPDGTEVDTDPTGTLDEDTGHYKELPLEEGGEVGTDSDGEPYMEYDEDGDGKMEPDELAAAKEYEAEFKDIPDDVDEKALDARSLMDQLKPSLTIENFRKLVRLAKGKVLERMKAKMIAKNDKKMEKFSFIVMGFSLLGVLLLLTPLFLRKKYPGQGATLFKFSGLAALVFFVTVNLFGAVMYGMKIGQSKVAATAPNIALASGFFDTLDDNAEQYIVMGKELFAPTLEQLTGKSDDQPSVALIANGQKVIKDAMVFVRVAKLLKKIDFIIAAIPMILLFVTIILFALAIKPTLVEIIKLPAAAASGKDGASKEVVGKAMKRVKGELLASLCALGVLFVLSLISSFILGRVAQPALTAIIDYFCLAVTYLQYAKDASSGMVFLMLFSVIIFLVLNIGMLIVSVAFFMGKTQKIFQRRFNDDVALGKHARFWKWGTISVVIVQVIPLVFVMLGQLGLEAINKGVMTHGGSAADVNWTMAMLAGPLFLVFGFLIFFWAARGFKAIAFLFKYKPQLIN
ncbi:MAG: hypothetical protein K8W52_03130 [Deltaproteobacteria bacterium]|nr:hypothetical protein [Deltaproteobacteria bacterium]